MPKIIDLTGQKFGRWAVVSFVSKNKQGALWECTCDCGVVRNVKAIILRTGKSKSCGCLKRELCSKRYFKHGKRGEPIFRLWHGIRQRCYNESHRNFYSYGGRGIRMYHLWKDDLLAFEKYIVTLGPKKPGDTLDRIDNDKGYEPGNLRWASVTQQRENRRPYGGSNERARIAAKYFNIDETTLKEILFCSASESYYRQQADLI